MDELEKTAQETAAEEQTGDTTAPDAGEDFETLIRGRYKGKFDARVRKILDGRLRGLRQENERLRQEAVRTELLRQREQAAGTHADIHEQDEAYLENCLRIGRLAAAHYGWTVVPFMKDGAERALEEKHEEIFSIVRSAL